MVQIRTAKSVLAFRNKTTNGFGAQIRLHKRCKTANGFRTRCNYYYIWPITLLGLKYIITSARNAAAIAKGMVELRSMFFYSREERERWRQGRRCLRCSKLRRMGGLGGLMMALPEGQADAARVSRVDYTQAPWTIAILKQPSQSIHTSREAYTFRRRFRIPYAVSWAPVLLGNTAEVV